MYPVVFSILLFFMPILVLAQSLVSVEGAYVRATPPVASNSAAFMTLRNKSAQEQALIAVKSNVAKYVELHNHINDDGVMRMRQVPQITLPAKGSVVLRPGAYHVMLIGLHQPIKDGDEIEITLVFGDGNEQVVKVPARHVMQQHVHHH